MKKRYTSFNFKTFLTKALKTLMAISVLGLTWSSAQAQTPGESCDDPIVVTTLPFTDAGNTSTYGDNYSSTDVPTTAPGAITDGTGSNSYLDGDDVVYSYTPISNEIITVSTTNDDDWIGLWAFSGCPFASTVGYHTATSGTARSIVDLPLTAGETYYFVISSWPAPQSTDYTIEITKLADCSGTPDAGTITAPATACADDFNLVGTEITGVSGIEYQWQESTDGSTWNDISGANTFTYTVLGGITVDTYYRLNVTCSFSAQSDASNELMVEAVSGAACICIPTGAVNNTDEILNFTLSNLNNTSAPSEGTAGYSDYTTTVLPANLERGIPYVAELTSNTGSGNHGAAIWIDYNDNGVFEASERVAVLPNNIGASATVSFPSFTVPLSVPLGQYRLRVQYRSGQHGNNLDPCVASTYAETEDYLIEVLTEPSCVPPMDIDITSLTGQTADLSWTAGNTETAWNVSWGTPGYTPGDGDEVGTSGATTNTYEITALTPETQYELYVQADCGSGDESMWVGPIAFTTPCATITAPWLYDVESATATTNSAIDDCWSSTPNNTTSAFRWNVGSSTPSSDTGPNSANSGTKFFYVEASSGSQNDSAYLVTPLIDVSSLTTPSLSFYYHMYGAEINSLIVQVSSDNGATWTTESIIQGEQQTSGAAAWEERYVNLQNYSGVIMIKFVAARGSGYYGDTAIDDIMVDELPSCLKPIDLTSTAVTNQTADITWTAGDAETAWNVSWGTPGYTPGDVDEIGTSSETTNSAQITGLTADTHYDIYVQADCGGGDESLWTGPLSVYTGYCIPTSTGNTTRYIDGVATSGALTNLNNTGTGLSPNAYGNYSGTDTLRVYPGQSFNLILTHPAGEDYNYKIWVDWDNTMDFDGLNDEIYTTSGYQFSPHIVPITIPVWVNEGTYRVRIRNSWLSLGGPCGNNGSSETEDYTLHVVAPPTCLPPSDLVTTAMTFQTADVSWTAGGAETDWNISWGTPGYTIGDANELGTASVTSNSYQITGLTADTHYDVYVQADCGGGDESFWAGPFDIFTGYCDVSTSFGDYLSEITSDGAVSDISYTASSQPSGSYANETAQLFRAYAGQQFDIETAFSDTWGSGVNIWVDWDQNMEFNATTELWSGMTGSGASHTHVVEVPVGTAPGTYRMRVRGQYGTSANPPACGNVNYGSTVDFDLIIVDCDIAPGVDGFAEVCRADGTVDLDAVATLNSTDGNWEFAANPGILSGSTFNISSLPAGAYEVLYVVDIGCAQDTTIATINVFGLSSAGTGGVITVCKKSPIDLYSALSGNVDMGGDWYDYNGNLLGNSQPTSPNLGASYNYTYITSNGVCPADTAIVEVIVDPNCTSDIQEEMMANLSVYPNPTSGIINIVNPTNISALKVEVIDMNGRVVLTENKALNNAIEGSVNLGKLNTGVYTLRVYNNEGQKIFKVVKR